ncbi:MAG: hypothetical protein K6C32_02060 [Bacilli bacterium]|nr:hypothetical protein [Bacilli bacterium]
MSILIKPVTTKKEQKLFIEFPNKLYKDNPYYVPPLYMDEKQIFKKDYVYYDTSDAYYFLAYKDNEVVGRISAIHQKASNAKWKQKRLRFTRFDSIDDQEVANALFDKVMQIAKDNNLEEVVGPLGFSDLEREGLLIEGFDYLNTYEEQYNFPYYQKLLENYGFKKDVDWLEHRLTLDEKKAERIINYAPMVMKRYNLRIVDNLSIKQYVKKYKDKFFEILDIAYDNIYGSVPFTDGMKKMIIDNFKLIINMKYLGTVENDKGEIVAFSIAFPSMSELARSHYGHLTLKDILSFKKYINHPKHIDLGLIGINPAIEGSSAGTLVLLAELMKAMKRDNIEYAETNLNLETNKEILNIWGNFNTLQHKRRRSFVKKVNE